MIDLSALIGIQEAPGEEVEFRTFPWSGPERWLLEARYRRPWHLETWPQTNLRARIIYHVARFLGTIGLHLPSQNIVLTITDDSLYNLFRKRFDALGVFLGTPGPNRKFVVYAKEGEKAWFIKVPCSLRAVELAKVEAATLDTLSEDANLAKIIPQYFWIDKALVLEDVRLAGARFSPLSDYEILNVHDMLFNRSQSQVPLHEILHGWEVKTKDNPPHFDTKTAKLINATRHAARAYLNTLDPVLSIPCYKAHGDFTYWNVLKANDDTARVIDWELFGRRPKFFDPIHYLVSHAILIKRQPPITILKRVKQFSHLMDAPELGMLHFGLYLCEQATEYCAMYERTGQMFPQVYWNLETWKELLILVTDLSSRKEC